MKNLSVFFAVLCLVLFVRTAGAAVGGSDLTFKPEKAGPVLFSHSVHVDVKAYKCSACHYALFQMTKNSYRMNMGKITKGEFCGTCHNGKRSFDVKDKASCGRCHK